MTAGRHTVMTLQVLEKLEQAFMRDMTDAEACLYAGIGVRTLYDYQKDNPEFSQRKELLKNHVAMKAKTLVADAIETGMLTTAQWWLERRRKDEFATRTDGKITHEGGDKPLAIVSVPPTEEEAARAYAEMLRHVGLQPKT